MLTEFNTLPLPADTKQMPDLSPIRLTQNRYSPSIIQIKWIFLHVKYRCKLSIFQACVKKNLTQI